MVKINRADLDPKAFTHTLKGFYLRETRRGVAVCKSPTFGKRDNRNSAWWRNQFGLAAQMAASPIWLDQISAQQVSKGTEQVARDILMMAAFGNLIGMILPDGRETTVADHGPTQPAPPVEKHTMLVASVYDDAYSITARTSGYEVAGGEITFGADTAVTHLTCVCGQYGPWDCTVWIVKMDASRVITEIIQQTPAGTFPAARTPIRVEHRATYAKGESITVLLQRTSGDGGHSFTIPTTASPHWLYPMKGQRVVDVPGNVVAVGVTCRDRYASDCIAIALEVEN